MSRHRHAKAGAGRTLLVNGLLLNIRKGKKISATEVSRCQVLKYLIILCYGVWTLS